MLPRTQSLLNQNMENDTPHSKEHINAYVQTHSRELMSSQNIKRETCCIAMTSMHYSHLPETALAAHPVAASACDPANLHKGSQKSENSCLIQNLFKLNYKEAWLLLFPHVAMAAPPDDVASLHEVNK